MIMWPSTMSYLLLVTISLLICICSCCVESERQALFHLRESLNHPNGKSLLSWGCHPDCCQWEGVECHLTTKRVTVLSLNGTRDNQLSEYWYLNSSLFLPFQDLRALYLVSNRIGGCLENEGFNKLSGLKNFQVLDISANYNVNEQVLLSLNGITSLTYLDFSMALQEEFHYMSFENLRMLKNLEFLDLSYSGLDNRIIPYLDAISSLKTLRLSYNQLEGTLQTLGAQDQEYGFSKLGNLEVLNLEHNQLGNQVFSSLRRLPSLKVLYLNNNNLNGSLLTAEVNALRNLEELHLGGNDIEEFISSPETISLSMLKVLELSYMKSILDLLQISRAFPHVTSLHLEGSTLLNQRIVNEGFLGFRNLEELYLDQSSLGENFLQNIRLPNSIKVLSLYKCNLNGTLHSKGLCEMKNLQELSLGGNNLQGTLPSCFNNLTSLRVLDISDNLLTGDIAGTLLSNLSLLEFFYISDNNFRIPNSFSPFMNNSKLRILIANNNELIPEPEPTFQAPPSRFQLYFFSSTNTLMKQLPQFLYSQNSLRALDLSNNNITGMNPSWILRNNSRLEILRLRNNHFTGPLTLPLLPKPHLLLLDVAKINMGGQVPETFGLIFPKLKFLILDENAFEVGYLESQSLQRLSLSNNGLEGNIPSSLGNMTTLSYLDLSNNQLSGEVPKELISGCLPLRTLRLSNNRLEGEIHPMLVRVMMKLKDLGILQLDGNQFDGEIQDVPTTTQISGISTLDIKNNNISGKLPRWISSYFPEISFLDMSNNGFDGPIPKEFCQLDRLSYLDISSNNLSGSISSCFENLKYLLHVHLGQNQLTGNITNAFDGCLSLVTLDLSSNHLSGNIPAEISSFPELSVLSLKGNMLEGEIPVQICQMKKLSLVDLSHNNLLGSLPSCLNNLTFMPSYTKSLLGVGVGLAESMLDYDQALNNRKAYKYLESIWENYIVRVIDHMEEQVEFATKHNSYKYKGNILNSMSGLDLSSNHLFGEIPLEIGGLSEIHALNLSHNNFTGPIPSSLSDLRQIESMDLSHNLLSGEIPQQLVQLTTLEVFNVAFNNLSGPVPDQKGQFGTFDMMSYEGNPLLCGKAINISCHKVQPAPKTPINDDGDDEDSFFDMHFYVSFLVAYVMTILVGSIWFHYVEVITSILHDFVHDVLHLRS